MKNILIIAVALSSLSAFAFERYLGNGITVTAEEVSSKDGLTRIAAPFFYVDGDVDNRILIKANSKSAKKLCQYVNGEVSSFEEAEGSKVYGFGAVQLRESFDINKKGDYLTSVTCSSLVIKF